MMMVVAVQVVGPFMITRQVAGTVVVPGRVMQM